jgi:hypothetical protein
MFTVDPPVTTPSSSRYFIRGQFQHRRLRHDIVLEDEPGAAAVMPHEYLQAGFPLACFPDHFDPAESDHALVFHAPAAAIAAFHEDVLDVHAETGARILSDDVELAALIGAVEIEDELPRLNP